jgi:hypothetical protein
MSHRVPADVAWVGVGDPAAGAVYLMKVPDGRPVVLEGSAAAIWTLAVSGADPVSGIADLTGEAEEVVASHTLAFLADLIDRGLLLAPPLAPDERKISP